MSRVTDTRARVRELAERLQAEGLDPTPTVIRTMLGRGSPNTIVDELRAWERDRLAARPAAVVHAERTRASTDALERIGMSDLAGLLRQAATHAQEMSTELAGVREAVGSLHQLEKQVAPLASAVEAVVAQHAADRAWFQEELAKAYLRFEAVQKMMMMSVSEARDQVKFWKDEATQQKLDATSWRLGQGELQSALRDEIARLKGRLEVYERRN